MTKLASRPVSVMAGLACLSFFLGACEGGPAHNGVASLGHASTTTSGQSSAPTATSGGSGGGQAPSGGGGGAAPPGGLSATLRLGGNYTQDLKFAECLRSHGLPNFPDPSSDGTFHITSSNGVTPGSPQFQAAEKSCRKFMPNGGAAPSPAQQARMLAQLLKYSECMRSHGVTEFPDPQSINGRVGFSITASPGSELDPNNPQFQAADKACESLVPGPP